MFVLHGKIVERLAGGRPHRCDALPTGPGRSGGFGPKAHALGCPMPPLPASECRSGLALPSAKSSIDVVPDTNTGALREWRPSVPSVVGNFDLPSFQLTQSTLQCKVIA